MEWFVRSFLRASLVWFGLGITLGVAMAFNPVWAVYRALHLHLNLLGFGAMIIFGVAYHVIPRFFGSPLHSRSMAATHWWLSQAGLAVLSIGFLLTPSAVRGAWAVVTAGGMVFSAGSYAFIYNLWRTMEASPAGRRAPVSANAGVPERRLPVQQRS